MRKEVIAMVLVGGRGSRLDPITRRKAKPAVMFGGKYRLIDFVLSNLTNSQIDTVGMVTQYEPHELMHYIEHGASWDLDLIDGGIQFLTPYTDYEGDRWQKGTAHAIRQHMHFITQHDPDHVLILSGDHVYKMDYTELIEAHKQSGAAFTIASFTPHDTLSRYGVLEVDADGFVNDFEEKPQTPQGSQASMGIYVFKREALEAILSPNMPEGFDFGKDIIPRALNDNYPIYAYPYDGYFRDVGTIQSLYEANMDLIDHPELLRLNDYKQLPVYTKSSDYPPHHVMLHEPIRDALISDGCMIQGRVERSIISPNVVIRENADVKNSIVFPGVTINENCTLENVIVLEDTVVMPSTHIVYDSVQVIDNAILWALGDGNEK